MGADGVRAPAAHRDGGEIGISEMRIPPSMALITISEANSIPVEFSRIRRHASLVNARKPQLGSETSP